MERGRFGAVIGLLIFLEELLFGGVGAEPIGTLPILVVLGALVGVEWNERHFLERFGTGGLFARWALAGMSVGATVGDSRRRRPGKPPLPPAGDAGARTASAVPLRGRRGPPRGDAAHGFQESPTSLPVISDLRAPRREAT